MVQPHVSVRLEAIDFEAIRNPSPGDYSRLIAQDLSSQLAGSGLRSGESCEGFLNARAIACSDIAPAHLVELAQDRVGVGENSDAFDVGFQL
jgi:hypothetical protein